MAALATIRWDYYSEGQDDDRLSVDDLARQVRSVVEVSIEVEKAMARKYPPSQQGHQWIYIELPFVLWVKLRDGLTLDAFRHGRHLSPLEHLALRAPGVTLRCLHNGEWIRGEERGVDQPTPQRTQAATREFMTGGFSMHESECRARGGFDPCNCSELRAVKQPVKL